MTNKLVKLFVWLTLIINNSVFAFEEEDPTDKIMLQITHDLREKCNSGKGISCTQLGVDYFLSENYTESFKFNELACRLNNGAGCESIASMYLEALGTKQDYDKALKFYKKSCNLNYALGCVGAGSMYLHGTGADQNLSIAINYYKKSCELGYKSSCITLKQIQLLLEKMD